MVGGKREEAEMKGEQTFTGIFLSFQCHLLPPSSFLPLFDSFLVSPLLVYSPLPAVFFPDHPLPLKTPCSASCCVFPARHFHSSEIQLNILAALSAPSDKHRNRPPLSPNSSSFLNILNILPFYLFLLAQAGIYNILLFFVNLN